MLEEAFKKFTPAEAEERFDANGLPPGSVYDLQEVFEDAQAVHNEMVIEADHPAYGTVKLTGFPVKLSDTPANLRRSPPNRRRAQRGSAARTRLHRRSDQGTAGIRHNRLREHQAG